MPSNMFSFINFEPLELYWTYFLALQTTTPQIPPMRLMSLDHEPKMRWCAMSLNHGLWHIFVKIWALLGFKRDYPKIHDNVNVVQFANKIKLSGVKNLLSIQVKSNMDQIDCYQNVRTKLTITPKYRDQNGVFT